MNRRTFLQTALACAAMAAVPAYGQGALPRPNIIFVMADDQGPWAWGGGGHPDAVTPNLDRIRAEGLQLTNYFVTCPVCSPSRASLVSSRYPTEVGITDYLGSQATDDQGLDLALPAWPRFLQDAGYRTGFFGKWHVGRIDRFLPTHFGYDTFTGWRSGAEISKDPVMEIDGVEQQLQGYTPDLLMDRALAFLDNEDDAPFLMSVHFFAPHANAGTNAEGDRTWLPLSDADWDLFKDLDPTLPQPQHPDLDIPRAKRMTREYLASVHAVDRNVGRLLAALDEKGLAENTIVVYTSDHGYNLAHHGIWHKGNGRWLLTNDQGSRPNLWDNSLRAPALVRWPAAIEAGSAIGHTTSNVDWFPTLLAMAGVALPGDTLIRGHDWSPLVKDPSLPWNDDFFAQYDMWDTGSDSGNLRAYRTPEWKLIRDFRNEGRDELYHLATDPSEETNLIDSDDPAMRDQRAKLETLLRDAMAQVGDGAYRAP